MAFGFRCLSIQHMTMIFSALFPKTGFNCMPLPLWEHDGTSISDGGQSSTSSSNAVSIQYHTTPASPSYPSYPFRFASCPRIIETDGRTDMLALILVLDLEDSRIIPFQQYTSAKSRYDAFLPPSHRGS